MIDFRQRKGGKTIMTNERAIELLKEGKIVATLLPIKYYEEVRSNEA